MQKPPFIRKHQISCALTAALLMLAICSCASISALDRHRVRNVIVMVPDGCSASIQTLSRWYKGDALNLDGLNTGSVKTHMANSVITGSAAAGSAFATGHKTSARFLSVGPRREDLLTGFIPTAEPYAPVATVLEGAKSRGKSTGLVVTSRVSHATPAAFACHVHDRGLENDIMEQMVHQNIDVVFGGGARHLIPSADSYTTSFGGRWKGKRTDGENLMQVLADRGYRFVDNRDDLLALTHGPVWGLFSGSHLDPHIDRDDFHPTQPSLAEMTATAIKVLSRNPEGFFLMVEGSQIDWAAHANDPVYMLTEFLAFDEAVGKALEFARRDGQTLVLIFPDHNTGGLSIGHQQSPFTPNYTRTRIEDLIDPLKKATITIKGLIDTCPATPTADDIQHAFEKYWGMRLNEQQAGHILNLGADSDAVAEYISRQKTVLGWTTHGHSGEDVPLWSYGPGRPVGTLDNTDLAGIVAKALQVDLADQTRRLFVELSDILPAYEVDDPQAMNPLVRAGNGIVLAAGKDILIKNANVHRLDGLVVYAPLTGKVFVPEKAAAWVKKHKK